MGWDLKWAAADRRKPGGDFLAAYRRQDPPSDGGSSGSEPMRNVWIICRKELGSYFVSPIAYLLLTMFAVVFGFFFWNALGYFVFMGMSSQMRGNIFPMNVNEQLIRPLLAIGTFISTLTKNQIIAAAATFGVCLLLWVLEWVSGYETATWARVLSYMSVITHFESFSKGLLVSKDAVYYVTLIFLGLFLTARSIESLRWRS